jgi:valyl-tRNA synthetase
MKLPKAYEPAKYEENIYALWEKGEVFKPKNRGGEGHFSAALPPPNANANLHIGYGLTVAIYDILTRYNRMLGKETLMIPGADHAGFETQSVYERQLAKEGKSRFDFSREDLYRQIWDFVELNKKNFQSQIRALGASCDWSRFTYTLDNKVVAQAYSTFKKMWDEGLIYRGQRIVNFCTFHGTSFSDIEVVHKEEQGKLWHIKYPFTEGTGDITVATTRPETILGDTAVAVNPTDDRYRSLIGKMVRLPLTDREIPIITDEMVDSKFGSGAVKITPAHDPNDFEVAQRHKLPMISVIGFDGKITGEAPEVYRHLSVQEARKKIVDDLKAQGLIVDEQNYAHSVGHCYKCDTVIEPLLRAQWFVSMGPLSDKAIEALDNKKISFYPDSKRKQLISYLMGLKDWNISRQIAWGIPIPAFQNIEDPKDWIFDTRVHEETIEVYGKTYKRDPDVFDTWFSSSSWPYVTLDYPDTEDYKQFYPLSFMDTGGEILYPWVSRMIMLGLYVTDEIPFTNVYIHGYVMAEDGAKMSKSLGNTIDLMETIKKYGSDALRMGVVLGRVPAVNRPYDSRRIEEGRNFANKLWNIARFIEDKVGEDHKLRAGAEAKSPADHWILNKLSISAKEISRALDNYRLSEAYEFLYHFIWHDFADWYVEASKTQPNTAMLAYILEASLKLAHPFAPFVTETIWQTLSWEEGSILAASEWPKIAPADKKTAEEFNGVIEVINEARQIVKTLGVSKPNLYFQNAPALEPNKELIMRMAALESVSAAPEKAYQGLRLTGTNYVAWLDIERSIAEKYLNTLKNQYEQRQRAISHLNDRLSNQDYISKAPKELVEQTKVQLEDEQRTFEAIAEEMVRYTKIVQQPSEDDY